MFEFIEIYLVDLVVMGLFGVGFIFNRMLEGGCWDYDFIILGVNNFGYVFGGVYW